MAVYQLDNDLWFPKPQLGEDDGLVAVGGDLSVDRLLLAYSYGFFPWFAYRHQEEPMWYCPLQRFVIFPNEIHVSHSMQQLMKKDELLAANVGEILLPTEKYAQLRNGKRVVKEKLFLPGYVLVEANLQGEVAHTLRFMPNVLGFLGGLDNPTPVRQADINRILGTAEDITIKSEEVAIPFTVDEAVKVTDGPFSGFSGIIEEVNAEKRKLKVMVKIFGRKTPLELSYNQVEKE